jgi:PAS domain S-box-containing protein
MSPKHKNRNRQVKSSALAAAREALRRSSAVLHVQQEASPDGILVLDEQGRITSHNRRFCELWNIPQTAVCDGTDSQLLFDLLTARMRSPMAEMPHSFDCLYQQLMDQNNTDICLQDGRVLECCTTPVRSPDGENYGRIWQFRDVVTLRQAEEIRQKDEEQTLGVLNAALEAVVTLDDVLESISDAFYAVDGEWRFTYINSNAERIWGLRRDDLLGKILWEVFPLSLGSPLNEAMRRAVHERSPRRLDYWSPVLSAWLEVNLYPSSRGMAVYFRDVTERRQNEEEHYWLLRTAQSRAAELMAALESIPDAVFLGNEGLLTAANTPALALLGCTSLEDLNNDFDRVAGRAMVRDASTGEPLPLERWPYTKALAGEQVVRDLVIHHAALNRDVIVRCVAAPIEVNGGAIGAVAVHTDLRFSRQQTLLHRLIGAQEEERRVLAYELHDGLTQYVMAAHAHLQSFQEIWREEEARAERELDMSLSHLEQAVMESRRLVNGLRALALEGLGLAGALEQLVREEKARAGWESAEFIHNLAGVHFEEALETTIFRVAQEAITNARRHSQASRIRVTLLTTEGPPRPERRGDEIPEERTACLTLEVQDWGRGFVVGDVLPPSSGDYSHLGLQGMVERVNLAEGRFQLTSTPGEGTIIHAVFHARLRSIPQKEEGHNDRNDKGVMLSQ